MTDKVDIVTELYAAARALRQHIGDENLLTSAAIEIQRLRYERDEARRIADSFMGRPGPSIEHLGWGALE